MVAQLSGLMNDNEIQKDERSRPATEDDLRLPVEQDHSPMATTSQEASMVHALVDGHPCRAAVGQLGGWSTRVIFLFDSEASVPEGMTREFRTKHFQFTSPGVMAWGHEGRTVTVRIPLE